MPHWEARRVAALLGLNLFAVLDNLLRGQCEGFVPISCGPLRHCASPVQLLRASEDTYKDTETAYLASLVRCMLPAALLSKHPGPSSHRACVRARPRLANAA